uniref:Solute carrier organic anion transporter family member n=1 Tax=Strigamia maritima TaxID=126957 RepID=T1J9S9_STRMM
MTYIQIQNICPQADPVALKRCFECRSRGQLGDCGDPFNTNSTSISASVTVLTCISGWCGKIVDGTEDKIRRTERLCLPQAPSDDEERCGETNWENKKGSSSDASEITDSTITNIDNQVECGIWNCRPKCIQKASNIKVFVFLSCILVALQQTLSSGYLNSVITTIEKRFDINSGLSGAIASTYEIGNLVTIIFVSYLGSRRHIPIWLGTGTIVIGIGSLVFVLPQFLTERYTIQSQIKRNLTQQNICKNESDMVRVLPDEHNFHYPLDECENKSNIVAVALFMLAQLLIGCGGSPLFTLGTTYIDDHIKRESAALYIGWLYSMVAFGPVMGFLLGGYLLTFYVDFLTYNTLDLNITPEDPRWVGAWWGGFLIIGCLMLLVSIPVFSFPKRLRCFQKSVVIVTEHPRASTPSANTASSLNTSNCKRSFDSEEREKYGSSIRGQIGHILAGHQLVYDIFTDIPKSMKNLLSNPVFTVTCLGSCMELVIVSGFAVFLPKYLETQFSISKGQANVYTGGIAIPGACVGVLVGGFVLKKFQLRPKGAIQFILICNVICLMMYCLLFFLGCKNVKMAGTTIPYLNESVDTEKFQVNLTAICNIGCDCSPNDISLICGSDLVTYFSPCHAGCSTKRARLDQDYAYCKCISNQTNHQDITARNGPCPQSCHTIIPFMILLFLMSFVVSVTQMPILMIVLRSVAEHERAFALGIQFVIFRLFGYIPSPIMFGNVIDATCLLWTSNCNNKVGFCLVYDIEKFRYSFVGISAAVKVITATLYCIDWILIRQEQKSASLIVMHEDIMVTVESVRNRLAIAAVVIVGVFLLVSLVAILAIVLLSGSYRRDDESIGEYIVRLFTGSKSKCDKDPPIFEFLHSDWDGQTRSRGTVVQYRCGYISSTPVARIVECVRSGKWTEYYKKLEKCKLDNESMRLFKQEEEALTTVGGLTGCTERDPPPAGQYFRDWNELKWKPGTVINYYCSEDKESPLVMVVYCSIDLKWVTKTRNPESCECPELPPEYNEKKHLLNWEPNQRWIGTVLGYRCADHYDSPYEKLYQCSVNKAWEVTEVLNCDIKMVADASKKPNEIVSLETPSIDPTFETPAHPPPHAINRNRLAVAAVVIVGLFLLVSLVAILAIVLLSGSYRREDESIGEYIVRLFTGSKSKCDKDPPIFEFLHSDWDGQTRSRGTVVHYKCGYIFNTPIARKVECKRSGKWTESYKKLEKCKLDNESMRLFKQEEEALTTVGGLTGCTERDPPPAGQYFRDWNELKWKPGTVINYYCSEDKESPLVMVVYCSIDLKWVTKTRNPESCECPELPPEYNEKKHLLNWEPNQRWIGTVLGYRCADHYDSPYEKLYQCSVNKAWEVTEVLNCEITDKFLKHQPNKPSSNGPCPQSCHTIIPFMILLFLMSFVVFVTQMPILMIVRRSVAEHEKAFALGIQFVIFTLFGYISSIVFGNVIDATCLFWTSNCNNKVGFCLVYDIEKFRYSFVGIISAAVKVITATLYCIDWILIRQEQKSASLIVMHEDIMVTVGSVYSKFLSSNKYVVGDVKSDEKSSEKTIY